MRIVEVFGLVLWSTDAKINWGIFVFGEKAFCFWCLVHGKVVGKQGRKMKILNLLVGVV